jgi:phospholipid/cholesterol/gamma-HCH transport system substrate-binding protein
MGLDPKTYQAVVHVQIRNDIKIPDDSTIKITSSGILGGNYVAILPGGSDKMLAAGGAIPNTQGSVDLFGLISRTINSK